MHSNHKDVHDRLLLMIMMLRNISQTGLENTFDHLYKLIHLLTELFINITGAHDSSVTISKVMFSQKQINVSHSFKSVQVFGRNAQRLEKMKTVERLHS